MLNLQSVERYASLRDIVVTLNIEGFFSKKLTNQSNCYYTEE